MSLYRRKDSPYFWYKFQHKRKLIQRSTKSKNEREARIIASEAQYKLINNYLSGQNKTWEDLVKYYYDKYQKIDQRFLDWTMPYWAKKKLTDLTNADFVDRLYFRNLRVTAATCNRNFNTIRALLKKAEVELNWISKAPHIPKLKEVKFDPFILSREDQKLLLRRLPPHLEPIVEFALETGRRKTEIVTLTKDMYIAEVPLIIIPSQLSKNGEPQRIPITHRASQIIAEQPVKGLDLNNQIFKYEGRPIIDPARGAWRKAVKDCNLYGSSGRPMRFHDLRHTCASRLGEAGCTSAQIAYLLGWKSTRMVDRYTHLRNLRINHIPGYE